MFFSSLTAALSKPLTPVGRPTSPGRVWTYHCIPDSCEDGYAGSQPTQICYAPVLLM